MAHLAVYELRTDAIENIFGEKSIYKFDFIYPMFFVNYNRLIYNHLTVIISIICYRYGISPESEISLNFYRKISPK